MDLSTDIGFEIREELMVSPSDCAKPTKRLAHFLKPSTNSIEGKLFELPSHSLSSVPAAFEPKKWPLVVKFPGWNSPQKKWVTWVRKMAALHESTWKKAGIHEAILSSTYEIKRNTDLVLGLAEKWCSETNSFIFPWGEATVTLEDVMVSGYSVLGSPVFSPLETDELKAVEEKLSQVEKEYIRSASRRAEHYAWMNKFMDSGSDIEHEAFLVLWLSRFVFPRSYCLIVKSVFPIAVHLARGTRIALAPAILASLYRDLSLLKEKIVALTKLVGCEDEYSALKMIIRSPFQFVQVWAWERFVKLRPNPNLIKNGEPRFALWHKLMIRVENVRTVFDLSQECFDWRPYAKTLNNWKLPVFYGEKEMRVSLDTHLSQELQSFARCLRFSELVGIDCIEQYLPHRVAMQFGMDQDLPAFVPRANDSPYIGWCVYNKPISYADLYVPSRLYEAGVTTQYLESWKQSLLGLQGENDDALPQKRILTSSETAQKRSKKLKQTKKRKFVARTKITPRRLDGTNDLDNSLETSNQKRRSTNATKRAKKSVYTTEDKKEDSDAYASSEFPLKMLPLKLILMKEADNSPVPPGFPPKSNLVRSRDSAKENNLAITESMVSSKKQNDFQNMKISNGENSSSQSQTFPSLIADKEAVKITEPAEKVMQNEPANGGSENVREDLTESGEMFLPRDMSKNECSNGEGKNFVSMVPDELEAWVGRLERIVAELKAARFGHKMPV
ncbi:PMD domain-containing protein [Citrus sinensis]|uniref:uncharacterized protein LOC112095749 n=1 Tax=Citrus clementina TaxID=85681 RepID=UPI000CECFC50|nr:uncharacterized protein LOC112095749 [Citrus x clementina]XP_024953614.2 uncharacterized protein LOC112497972 [Citrus sinensis]KAH9651611.1 PMD domain-containing protein [Citrus sinensis]